jgi:hypothetical protein
MEGKGFYNKNASIPAAGGLLARPLLEEAAQLIHLDGSDRPIVIADYGSSEGKNSLAPMAGRDRSSPRSRRPGATDLCLSHRSSSQRLQLAIRGVGE